MTEFELAWQNLTLAGRELGSGPAAAVDRVLPESARIIDWLTERGVTVDRSGAILLGIAVGLVMADDERAVKKLGEITKEWLSGPADEFDRVQNMKLRMESLTELTGRAMMQAAHFGAALHDELREGTDDTEADYVAEQLQSINQRLASVYEELHELPSHLY